MPLDSVERHEPSFQIGSSIPVVRMLDEDPAIYFYLEFLGFAEDWRHRFRDDTPLYIQVRLGAAALHLDGHSAHAAATSTVRFPVLNLEQFTSSLVSRNTLGLNLEMARPRGTNLELCLEDPSGNLLIFQDVPELT